ncbi:hypothetical protein BDW02DRAFT_608931 [Decorospora gaudefroyi]|uniref:Extracellular membrane protein CFEM domain-containing protein n=1 Tax=Decorospora gaudefroyi TaxID=184978 RepID=A0A6A5K7D9_9PLEO|nr:hypothetical protein BDW02DRAFT_608931 [Decorospora gaudefroyi]
MGLTVYKISWGFVFLCLLLLANTQTIKDLVDEVRSSDAYANIRYSICAQCALAGSDDTGCWGQDGESAAAASPCPLGNATCFCDPANQDEIANLIQNVSDELYRKGCPMKPENTYPLAISGYREFCAGIGITVSPSLSPPLPTGSITVTTPTSAITGTSTSAPGSPGRGLGGGAIAGIVVGSIFGSVLAGAAIFFCIRRQSICGSNRSGDSDRIRAMTMTRVNGENHNSVGLTPSLRNHIQTHEHNKITDSAFALFGNVRNLFLNTGSRNS